jgi:hypothetical protein
MASNTAQARMSEDIITRLRAVAILSQIARNERNDVADRIHAIEILGKMHGWMKR